MEDLNTSSDDDTKESLSSELGGKKLKLFDGSSQERPKVAASSSKNFPSENNDNVDGGISADKSEGINSEDTAGGSEVPINELVNASTSSTNVRTILLNIRRPKRERNYRKRKTPDRDTDSNDSSRDSDDLSVAESVPRTMPLENSNSEADSDDIQRLTAAFSEGSPSGTNSSSGSMTSSYESDDMMGLQSGDTDEATGDEDLVLNDEDDENKGKPPGVLLKTRPKHNYLMLREIINREMGLTCGGGKSAKSDVTFEQNFYGSLHVAHRLKKLHSLHKHRGCVNSINFHPEGKLLASGSDDTNVVIWDWARNAALQTIKTGHKSNVFQSKFLYLNAQSQLNIVTCARDGQVRLLQCPPSGGACVSRRRLAAHTRAAHKLHVCAAQPHVVVSAGEDGLVMQCDVRAEHASRLFQVKDKGSTVPLYSVSGHPLEPTRLLVAGRDKYVRVYDTRKSTRPLAFYCPSTFKALELNPKNRARLSMMHLTCAVYSHDGAEILGSYNDEDIYLFDAANDQHDKDNPTAAEGYTYRYSGHRNSATFKGVAFFGPKSQYIVSGSDCSYIYVWEKRSESIVQWMQGDVSGVVNCIEAHPRCPVLATSGLDKDVKIWIPKNHKDPTYEGLGKVVRENVVSQLRSPLFNDFLPSLYSAWRGENRLYDDSTAPNIRRNIEFDGNVCTTF